jgi:hypothetical protein
MVTRPGPPRLLLSVDWVGLQQHVVSRYAWECVGGERERAQSFVCTSAGKKRDWDVVVGQVVCVRGS